MSVNIKDEMSRMQGDDTWLQIDKLREWPDSLDLGWFAFVGAKIWLGCNDLHFIAEKVMLLTIYMTDLNYN